MIKIKRIYDPASRDDGRRIYIDRLWPREMKELLGGAPQK